MNLPFLVTAPAFFFIELWNCPFKSEGINPLLSSNNFKWVEYRLCLAVFSFVSAACKRCVSSLSVFSVSNKFLISFPQSLTTLLLLFHSLNQDAFQHLLSLLFRFSECFPCLFIQPWFRYVRWLCGIWKVSQSGAILQYKVPPFPAACHLSCPG